MNKYWGVITDIGLDGVEHRQLGSFSWVRLDGRLSHDRLLSAAQEHFKRAKYHRIIIAVGESPSTVKAICSTGDFILRSELNRILE